jgi:hypothetical protein
MARWSSSSNSSITRLLDLAGIPKYLFGQLEPQGRLHIGQIVPYSVHELTVLYYTTSVRNRSRTAIIILQVQSHSGCSALGAFVRGRTVCKSQIPFVWHSKKTNSIASAGAFGNESPPQHQTEFFFSLSLSLVF